MLLCVLVFAGMPSRVHQRVTTAPAENKQPRDQGLGYAELGGSLGVTVREVSRNRLQIGYPDLNPTIRSIMKPCNNEAVLM